MTPEQISINTIWSTLGWLIVSQLVTEFLKPTFERLGQWFLKQVELRIKEIPIRTQALIATAPEFLFRLGLICLIVYVSIISALRSPITRLNFLNGGSLSAIADGGLQLCPDKECRHPLTFSSSGTQFTVQSPSIIKIVSDEDLTNKVSP